MAKRIWLKHDLTGKVEQYPEHYKNHPVLGKHLTPSDPHGCTSCGDNTAEEVAPTAETPVEVPSIVNDIFDGTVGY